MLIFIASCQTEHFDEHSILSIGSERLKLSGLRSGYWSNQLPTWLLWAAGAAIAVALLLPLFYLIIRAAEAGPAAWQNLWRINTLATLLRTIGLAAAVTLLSGAIAAPLAWLTVRTDVPWRGLWAILAPLPLVFPSYVGAYLLVSLFGPRGLLQQLLEPIWGVERLPEIYGFPGALLTMTLLSYPYMFTSMRAALLRQDPALEEAARSLGDGGVRTFWRVSLPLLRPAIGAGGLLVALYTLRDFGAVAIMRYDTFTRAIYIQYRSFDRSQAALLALLLVGITLLFVWVEARMRLRGRYVQGDTGAVRPQPILHLGWWRWPAFCFCAAVALFSLILPALVLVYWLVRGLLVHETIPALGQAIGHSVLASGLAAIVITLAALPVAILVVRHAGRLSNLLERLTYSAFALPGIVIALALVFFGANHAPWLYQTLPLLILAYGVLFLPQALGVVRASLLQINPSLMEAARSLGKNRWRVLWDITLPLLRPGLWGSLSLIFLTAMKELPATLLLAPIGFSTLATAVWSAVSEAFFAAAAAPALLIVLLSSLPMLFEIIREKGHERNSRPL
ncbi:MAG: iron ABC transporter permease [Caldilineaceae bacterium]|nr:iron ABC transporter permease [Caldilineaceae bacterium]